jgi:hypothetical protein
MYTGVHRFSELDEVGFLSRLILMQKTGGNFFDSKSKWLK